MDWRIGEIYDPVDSPASDPPGSRYLAYEIDPTWTAGLGLRRRRRDRWPIPVGALVPGRRYRARVRHCATTGHWSPWSPGAEFVAGGPTSPPTGRSGGHRIHVPPTRRDPGRGRRRLRRSTSSSSSSTTPARSASTSATCSSPTASSSRSPARRSPPSPPASGCWWCAISPPSSPATAPACRSPASTARTRHQFLQRRRTGRDQPRPRFPDPIVHWYDDEAPWPPARVTTA